MEVFGNSQKITFFGTLNPAKVSLQKSINSFSLVGLSLIISIKEIATVNKNEPNITINPVKRVVCNSKP